MTTGAPRVLRIHLHGRGRHRAAAVVTAASLAAVVVLSGPVPASPDPVLLTSAGAPVDVPREQDPSRGDLPTAEPPEPPEPAESPLAGVDVVTAEEHAHVAVLPLHVGGAPGIPGRVLAAYRRAAEWAAVEDPGCGLPWWLLAGIGRVESGHAGGGRVDDEGRTRGRILGPRLDGSLGGTAVIRDNDRGVLDGDAAYDRAVGPMQFLPGTWRGWGVDADGDGQKDPHDIDDAALAAARYLCAGGADLTSQAGIAPSVLRYNNSVAYVRTVLGWGRSYADGVLPVQGAPGTVAPAAPGPVPGGGAAGGQDTRPPGPGDVPAPQGSSTQDATTEVPPTTTVPPASSSSIPGSSTAPSETTPPTTPPTETTSPPSETTSPTTPPTATTSPTTPATETTPPSETTLPPSETTLPPTTTPPSETTLPPSETTSPPTTTPPTETTSPPTETTSPPTTTPPTETPPPATAVPPAPSGSPTSCPTDVPPTTQTPPWETDPSCPVPGTSSTQPSTAPTTLPT